MYWNFYTDVGHIHRSMSKHNKSFTAAETKKDTIRLLRTIVVLTQSLSSLPDNVMMTMKLLYYDEGIKANQIYQKLLSIVKII